MSWLLLAVFVALACLSAALWRAQVQRQNDQAFAAQAASVGASVTTAVRRMDDLTLAARTLLANEPTLTNQGFASWYASMGVVKRFRGVAGFGYTEIVRKRVDGVYPPGRRPYYCLPTIGVAGPGMAETLTDAAVPGYDLCQISKLFGADARHRPVQRLRHQLGARARDVRGRRARLPRRRRAEHARRAPRPRDRLDHRPLRLRADPEAPPSPARRASR